jgi:hypothetical protein
MFPQERPQAASFDSRPVYACGPTLAALRMWPVCSAQNKKVHVAGGRAVV